MPVLIADVQSRLRIALTTTLVDEWTLVSRKTGTTPPSERAVAFHLGWHLRPTIDSSWAIDCEYNRSGMVLESSVELVDHASGRGIPDLIVHRRGKLGPDDNLLVVEVATCGFLPADTSMARVRALQGRFGYRYGALVDLRLGKDDEAPATDPYWQWCELDREPAAPEPVYTPEVLAEILSRTTTRH